jgi:hypothetical protein
MKVLSVVLACVVLVGCGIGDSFGSAVGGMTIKQVETASLTCAVVQFGGSVSIDCVEKR